MIGRLSVWFMLRAGWKSVLLSFAAAMIALNLLNVLATPRVIEATGGLEPFDLQTPLSAEDIVRELPAYGPEARRAYMLFAAIDIPFPILAGIFQVFLMAWLIKCAGYTALTRAADRGFILIGIVPALFDLSENVAFISLVLNPPSAVTLRVKIAAFMHACKFPAISVTWAIGGLLIVAAIWGWLSRRRSSARAS